MKKILICGVALGMFWQAAYAGNPDRKGEAGATELNINGYGRSAGFWDLNCASVQGLEAERLNPAGLGYTQGTEIIAAYTSWLTGAGVNIVQAGFATRFKSNTFALTINSLNFGAIDRTTPANPEGDGLGQFKPTFLNIGASYAKNFSLGSNKVTGDNLITGGISLRLVSEIVGNVTATGFSFDVGLQYTTGKRQNVHFGISLRNVGTNMKFTGDGLGYIGIAEAGSYAITYNYRTNAFELPTQLNMGAAYDVFMGAPIEFAANKYAQFYRLTFVGQYSANAFGNDNWGLGAEFAVKEMFMVRAAYRFENDVWSGANTSTAYNGFAAGCSINIPFTKKEPDNARKKQTGTALSLDYGFRMTTASANFAGTHTLGLRINLGGAAKPKEIDKDDIKTPSAYDEKASEPAKKGKKGKATIEDIESRDAAIDSLTKANQALKEKADHPIVRTDTVIQKQVVIQRDTVIISLEKSDYNGADKIDTITRKGKKTLQFRDYETLEYETGSAKIQNKSNNYLNYLVNIMKKNPGYKVSFEGHTDNVGKEEDNQKLSEDRVNAVKAYFISKGIDGSRIVVKAYGSTRPKYENSNSAGRAKNRRVEIYMEM